MSEHLVCLHEDRWQELRASAKSTEAAVIALDRRLYRDNGSPCVQTRLDRMERAVRVASFVAGAAAVGTLGQLGRMLWQAMVHAAAFVPAVTP